MKKKQIEHIAKSCHEINRIFCEAHGDKSQPLWEDAPDWQKKSAIEGVIYALESPNVTSEMLHQSWMDLKEEEGWKYGKVKDAGLKEHPCMVPYEELPEDQKAKDTIFSTVVHSFNK